MNSYLGLIITAILSAGPPILIKMYIINGEKDNSYLYLSVIFSILVLIMYISLTKTYGATIMYTIVKILSILMVAVVGFLFLRESLTTKRIIGIIFAIIALYLLCSH